MKKEQQEEQGVAQPGMMTSPDPRPEAAPVAAPAADTSQEPKASADSSYDFITNPEAPPKKRALSIPGGANPVVMRVGIVAGGLVVLIIVFAIIKGVLIGGSDLTELVSVAQDQQEIIHLATNASQQDSLSSNNKNFAMTAQLSMSSSLSQLITYMADNHTKTNQKQLNLKVSDVTDSQLTSAATAGTYNQSFQQIMQDQLDTYEKDLQKAYLQDKGQKGRALLSNGYNQAQLLITQLNEPSD